MKNLPFILGLIIMVLIGAIYVLVTELRDVNRVQQSTIDGLRKKNTEERDSLELILNKTKDSLDIAFATIRLAKEETQKAKEKSQREIRTLKSILFVRYESDSARLNDLKKLYPSLK